jgi:hypothetical protein
MAETQVKELQQSHACEPGLQYVTGADLMFAAT